jgi:dihydrolipoamide dehydrogenase
MAESAYDVIVIGPGAGGYVTAIRAAQLGFKTAVVGKDKIGGRCLNYACIPAKAVLRVADVAQEIREAGDMGITVSDPQIDFAAGMERRGKVVSTLTGGVTGLLSQNSADVIEGVGSLNPDGKGVTVNGTSCRAKFVVLATGSVKRPIPGTDFGGRVIGTEAGWGLPELPKSLTVIGSGASGSEIASAYARLGVEVNPLKRSTVSYLLRTLTSQSSSNVVSKNRGSMLSGTLVSDVVSGDKSVTYKFGDSSGKADYVVIAAGREPDIQGLGLDAAGIKMTDRGLIEVDGAMRTNLEVVYAIGDLVPGPALAHKASDEGVIAVENAAGLATHPISYVDIPRATFCSPNVASFGLTEEQAKEQGYDVVVGKVQYGQVGAGIVYGDRSGLVKIIGDRKYGEPLGGHIVGSKATELIQELASAKNLEAGYPEVARIIHGHPTFSEAVMEAARAADGWLIHG